MEAATLTKKKSSINKGKVKKSLRNVLCRPDHVFWPELSDEHGKILESALEKHKVDLPNFEKPHWKEIKSIPKDQRQKAPKIPRVEGLLFGITEVTTAVLNKKCSAMVIESSVNPRTIVLPLIEQCIDTKIPTLCLKGLRKITADYFGIPTSCLGVKCDCLEDLKEKISDLVKHYSPPLKKGTSKEDTVNMQVDMDNEVENTEVIPIACPYLYRTNKRTRVFNPSVVESKSKKAFIGQDFIEFTDKPAQKTDSKAYMNMILKKISNNQNRVKRK